MFGLSKALKGIGTKQGNKHSSVAIDPCLLLWAGMYCMLIL